MSQKSIGLITSPSTKKHKGVKVAQQSEEAAQYFRFFSASAEAKTTVGDHDR